MAFDAVHMNMARTHEAKRTVNKSLRIEVRFQMNAVRFVRSYVPVRFWATFQSAYGISMRPSIVDASPDKWRQLRALSHSLRFKIPI